MRRKRGFTLVELLVVIVIMAIMMGIMLPAIMPLLVSSGIDASARKLQSVLMNARALAAKEGAPVSVVFNAYGTSYNTRKEADNKYYIQTYTYGYSRDWNDNWFVVIKHDDYTTSPFASEMKNVAGKLSNDFGYKQVGPRYTLEDGTGFLSLSADDGSGSNTWNSFNSDGTPKWPGTSMSKKTAAYDYLDSNYPSPEWTAPGSWDGSNPPMPAAGAGAWRITFLPDGSARFYEKGSLKERNEQIIGISREGTIKSKTYYDNRLAVVVNRYTGLVEIRGDYE